jgi:hypothetical protein
LPEKFRSLDNWPKPMREQWGTDEGRAHSEAHRQAMVEGFRRARAALEAFNPDFCVIWGDDQFENYREDCVPPFSILAYENVEVQPWLRDQRGANSWNEPKEKSFAICGHRQGAKYLASCLLNEGFDIPYAYKPRHAALGHAFTNSILFLDWDRRGFPYPLVPFTTNAYGRESRRAADADQGKRFSGQRRSTRAAAMALFSNRRGLRARFGRKSVESRVDRIVELVALVSH